MCEIDFDSVAEVWHEMPRKARKRHVCSSCRGLIKPGDRYFTHFSVCDGSPASEKICAPCQVGRDEFADAHGSIGLPSRFGQELVDCFNGASREEWNNDDRRWRSIYAGMLLRRRKARAA